MALCVFPILEDVCCPIILQEGMPTAGHVHIRAGGNILWLKRSVRVSISRYMRNERGTYIFNSKDLCMIEHIPDLLEAGIDSFKIEDV